MASPRPLPEKADESRRFGCGQELPEAVCSAGGWLLVAMAVPSLPASSASAEHGGVLPR